MRPRRAQVRAKVSDSSPLVQHPGPGQEESRGKGQASTRQPGPGRSVLIGHQHGKGRLALVAGAAQGLEANERRGAVAVVVADVDAEADLGPAAGPADRTGEQPKHFRQPFMPSLIRSKAARFTGQCHGRSKANRPPPRSKATAKPASRYFRMGHLGGRVMGASGSR